ncbi:protoglobin domain-containing protein [Maricaulis sp.]|uniref:protoglobin domain-containing protein n=3 Tax=Maricaulis TaxID=74317 RepID=UPI00262A4CF1|nr:protoglobin domain-containing protein [Maricaulis sp.]MDF1767573.1 protoglobin domain-containing protein [Maricaulis sp.]
MNEEARSLQREFFRIDEDVIDRIQHIKPRLMEYAAEALETVFDHLVGNPEVAHYFEIADNVAYLRAGMLAHCDELFSARFDEHYYEATESMGERHAKLEFPSHVYTAAYSNMFARIVELAMANRRRFKTDDITAMSRITHYDVELSMGAFYRHIMDKRAALTSDVHKIRHLVD